MMKGENFSVFQRATVLKSVTILAPIWKMRCKRDIKSSAIENYKARLNIDGSTIQKGMHYDQPYAPVVSLKSIILLLIIRAVYGWYIRQLD